MTDADRAALERFRSFVAERMGWEIPDEKLPELHELLRARMAATRADGFESYLRRLVAPDTTADEIREVARLLTVGESYFFRNLHHFQALLEVVLPARAAVRPRTRGLTVLSAGCSSGEEAYTIAMLLREHPALTGHLPPPAITGIDVNPTVLDKARRGRYTEWSLRATPPAARQRWFRREGGELALDDSLRSMVRFELGNLADNATGPAAPASLDIIFCRNVFIYFSRETIRNAVDCFARALEPGGYLFLGEAESLRGISTAFELCHTHETFYYRLRGKPERRGAAPPPVTPAPEWLARPQPAAPAAAEVPGNEAWMDAIGKASRRVASLSKGAARARAGEPAAPRARARPAAWDLQPIRALVEQEREAEALAAVAALPKEAQADPEVKLLAAALQTNRGDLAAAERTCRELLALDEFNAGAHYLLAVGCEQRAALAQALEHDRIATYLDPAFAMPRLQMGRLARRSGDLAVARRELLRALELLEAEDASRLALFAGGFSREGLRQICRTEIGACGGAP